MSVSDRRRQVGPTEVVELLHSECRGYGYKST